MRLHSIFLLLASAAYVQASITYISDTGPNSANFSVEPTQTLVASWTQTVTLANVQISALLAAAGGLPTGNAFLTNKLGAGTTSAANEIAKNLSAPFPAGSTPAFSVLFSGLTLPAGTYYLTITGLGPGDSDNNFWEAGSPSSLVTAAGVTYNGDRLISGSTAAIAASETQAGYLPSASFISLELGLQFIVSDTAAVPEPASYLLVGAAGGLLALAAKRRTWRA